MCFGKQERGRKEYQSSVATSSPGRKDATVDWSSSVLPAVAMVFVFVGGLRFFLRPFGWSSRRSWGRVREPRRSSSSWMACSAVLLFVTLSSMRLLKDWYWDHFCRAWCESHESCRRSRDINGNNVHCRRSGVATLGQRTVRSQIQQTRRGRVHLPGRARALLSLAPTLSPGMWDILVNLRVEDRSIYGAVTDFPGHATLTQALEDEAVR